MIRTKIGKIELLLEKEEVKDAERIRTAQVVGGDDCAQRAIDFWVRDAPTALARERRNSVARSLGLCEVAISQKK